MKVKEVLENYTAWLTTRGLLPNDGTTTTARVMKWYGEKVGAGLPAGDIDLMTRVPNLTEGVEVPGPDDQTPSNPDDPLTHAAGPAFAMWRAAQGIIGTTSGVEVGGVYIVDARSWLADQRRNEPEDERMPLPDGVMRPPSPGDVHAAHDEPVPKWTAGPGQVTQVPMSVEEQAEAELLKILKGEAKRTDYPHDPNAVEVTPDFDQRLRAGEALLGNRSGLNVSFDELGLVYLLDIARLNNGLEVKD